MEPKRRFIFGAQAIGVAAHIRRPEDTVFPVQAASCIPVTGGWSNSRVVGKTLKGRNSVTFELAATSARGDFVDLSRARDITLGKGEADSVPTRTSATALLRELRVVNKLRISAIQAGIVAQTDVSGRASFQLVDTSLKQIQFGSAVLNVELATDYFNQHDTMAKLADAFQSSRAEDQALFFSSGDKGERTVRTLPESHGVVFATIVRRMHWDGDALPDSRIEGNALTLPNFGTAYFGELLISEYSRRLTMVRFSLGSDTGGDCCAAEVEVQGSTWP